MFDIQIVSTKKLQIRKMSFSLSGQMIDFLTIVLVFIFEINRLILKMLRNKVVCTNERVLE